MSSHNPKSNNISMPNVAPLVIEPDPEMLSQPTEMYPTHVEVHTIVPHPEELSQPATSYPTHRSLVHDNSPLKTSQPEYPKLDHPPQNNQMSFCAITSCSKETKQQQHIKPTTKKPPTSAMHIPLVIEPDPEILSQPTEMYPTHVEVHNLVPRPDVLSQPATSYPTQRFLDHENGTVKTSQPEYRKLDHPPPTNQMSLRANTSSSKETKHQQHIKQTTKKPPTSAMHIPMNPNYQQRSPKQNNLFQSGGPGHIGPTNPIPTPRAKPGVAKFGQFGSSVPINCHPVSQQVSSGNTNIPSPNQQNQILQQQIMLHLQNTPGHRFAHPNTSLQQQLQLQFSSGIVVTSADAAKNQPATSNTMNELTSTTNPALRDRQLQKCQKGILLEKEPPRLANQAERNIQKPQHHVQTRQVQPGPVHQVDRNIPKQQNLVQIKQVHPRPAHQVHRNIPKQQNLVQTKEVHRKPAHQVDRNIPKQQNLVQTKQVNPEPANQVVRNIQKQQNLVQTKRVYPDPTHQVVRNIPKQQNLVQTKQVHPGPANLLDKNKQPNNVQPLRTKRSHPDNSKQLQTGDKKCKNNDNISPNLNVQREGQKLNLTGQVEYHRSLSNSQFQKPSIQHSETGREMAFTTLTNINNEQLDEGKNPEKLNLEHKHPKEHGVGITYPQSEESSRSMMSKPQPEIIQEKHDSSINSPEMCLDHTNSEQDCMNKTHRKSGDGYRSIVFIPKVEIKQEKKESVKVNISEQDMQLMKKKAMYLQENVKFPLCQRDHVRISAPDQIEAEPQCNTMKEPNFMTADKMEKDPNQEKIDMMIKDSCIPVQSRKRDHSEDAEETIAKIPKEDNLGKNISESEKSKIITLAKYMMLEKEKEALQQDLKKSTDKFEKEKTMNEIYRQEIKRHKDSLLDEKIKSDLNMLIKKLEEKRVGTDSNSEELIRENRALSLKLKQSNVLLEQSKAIQHEQQRDKDSLQKGLEEEKVKSFTYELETKKMGDKLRQATAALKIFYDVNTVQDNDALNQQLSNIKGELKEKQIEYDNLQTERNRLFLELESHQTKSEHFQKENNDLGQKFKELESHYNDLHKEKLSCDLISVERETKLEVLLKENEANNRMLRDQKNNNIEFQNEKAILKLMVNNHKSNVETMNEQHKKEKEELNQNLHSANDILTNQKCTYEQLLREKDLLLKTSDTNYNEVKKEHNLLFIKINEIQKSLDGEKTRTATLERIYAVYKCSLDEEISQSKALLEKEKEDAAKHHKENEELHKHQMLSDSKYELLKKKNDDLIFYLNEVESKLNVNMVALEKVKNALGQHLSCSVCSKTLSKAIYLNCGHTFCRGCIGREKEEKEECPNCKANIISETKIPLLDHFLETMSKVLT